MGTVAPMTSSAPTLGIRLEPDSPLPLYAQLHAALRRRILDGRCPEGALLPSENDLAEALGVSRITIKRAFDELAASGLVRRRRGHGTEVLRGPAQRPVLASVDGLVENSLVMGRDTEVELLEFAYVPADEAVAEALDVAPGALVQKAVRVRRELGEPFSRITTWIPEAVGRGFGRGDLITTPLVALLERAGVRLSSAEQAIGAENADAAAALALGVAPGAALLRVERLSRDQRGTPVERAEVLYNPARYRYRMLFEHIAEATATAPRRPPPQS